MLQGGSYPPYVPPAYAMHDYRKLYKMLATHYRLWIYNGQDDGCIPYVGAQASSQPNRLVCRRLLSVMGRRP